MTTSTTIILWVVIVLLTIGAVFLWDRWRHGPNVTRKTLLRAVEKTIDQLRQHPETYLFIATEVGRAGERMCMWGWIGHFLGFRPGTTIDEVVEACGCPHQTVLYDAAGPRVGVDTARNALKHLRAFARQLISGETL